VTKVFGKLAVTHHSNNNAKPHAQRFVESKQQEADIFREGLKPHIVIESRRQNVI